MAGMCSMRRSWPVLLAVVAAVGSTGYAQTLSVRMLDGRSGKPIAEGSVNVWVGDHRKAAVPLLGDRDGKTELSLTNDAGQVKTDGGPSDRPTFLYAPEVRIQVGFVLCQAVRKKFSWLQITRYSTEDWARTGIVTANICGKATAKPQPGELTLFVRPLTFWEGLSE